MLCVITVARLVRATVALHLPKGGRSICTSQKGYAARRVRPPPDHGVYGLRLKGVGADLLLPAERSWPELELVRRLGAASHTADELEDDGAMIVFRQGGEVAISRQPLRATFTMPSELRDAELLHPYLAPVAAVCSRWLGRYALHGGGVVLEGGAWGVLADREGGKSSLLAALALAGHGVVSDDVLVTDGAVAYAGPRAIDLREPAADHLQTGTGLGVVGARERWRHRLRVVSPTAVLRGWVFLAWADAVEVVRLPVADRLNRLVTARALVSPPDPEILFRLAALPAFELRRPHAWEALPEATSRLLETLAAYRVPG